MLTSTDHRRATAIDGSPVIDVKPYATEFNPAGPVREPASMREPMPEYYRTYAYPTGAPGGRRGRPGRLARFWAAALRWEVAAEEPDEVDVWPPGFSYPDTSALPLVFVPVPEPKTGKNRVHLDLATESRSTRRPR